jgi:hypothetical protein
MDSGLPRGKISRWNCGRFISRFAASRIASSRRSRLASAVAISSAVGPSAAGGSGNNSRDFRKASHAAMTR